MTYHCCDQLRRDAVAQHPLLNGIDYLEIIDGDLSQKDPLRQRTLLLRLLKPVAGLTEKNLMLTGGERVRNIHIEWAESASPVPSRLAGPDETGTAAVVAMLPNPENVLVIRTDAFGDHSAYLLKLVRSPGESIPPKYFDPRLVEIEFSFKVECPSEFDCKSEITCPKEPQDIPDINYLAKDYASFRRLILDRVTTLVPDWRERSVADIGVTLAELLAYAGDQLSYWQDAVASEAYLESARRRISLRRHALLVDYHMHDGCNARVWLHLKAEADNVTVPKKGTRFYTTIPGLPWHIAPDSADDDEALRQSPTVFEPLHDALLFTAHNEICIYTWEDRNCCLIKGSTRATLAGHLPYLKIGDLLLFEEVKGPLTGNPGDADPTHRHVVRLTGVQSLSSDDSYQPLTDPLTGAQIMEVTWDREDALPFQLCVSATTDKKHGSTFTDKISVARANMVLCDHGMTLLHEESLGAMPGSLQEYKNVISSSRCSTVLPDPVFPRFNPELASGPLTFSGRVEKLTTQAGAEERKWVVFDPDAPASAAMRWKIQDAIPHILLRSVENSQPQNWEAFNDLLNSDESDRHFVVEVEYDGSASLRFGDDQFGQRPIAGSTFWALYRVGNGRTGNVGAETIRHVVSADSGISEVRNPLSARGGLDAETGAEVRRRAPQAFRTQERAVTPADYAEVTERLEGVQRAAATLRWTGSWYTVFITVDREGGVPLDQDFEGKLAQHVERYRMAGHDVEFNDPVYISLEIDLLICVKVGYLQSDVRKSLLEILSNRTLADGRRGVFHPDNLSFGQTVYLGPIYAAAHAVAGVGSIRITRFARKGSNDKQPLQDGFLKLGRLEIPRLDNDPNFPEHGVLRVDPEGGM